MTPARRRIARPRGAFDGKGFVHMPSHGSDRRNARRQGIFGGRRGAAAIEFALVLPILVFILGGIVDFARAFFELQTMVNAASEGARMAIVSSDSSVDEDSVRLRVRAFFPDDPGSTTVTVNCSGTCSTPMGDPDDLVSITVSRPFVQLFLGIFNLPQFFGISQLPNSLSYTASGRRQ